MALRGSLQDATVPDVIQFVHASRRSGVLAVRSGSGEAWIEFDAGDVAFARSPSTRSLGVLLIDDGLLSLDQVAQAVRIQRESSQRVPLGRVLLERGLLSTEALTDAVRRQIMAAIEEVAGWTEGEFAFDPTPVLVADTIRVDIEEILPSVRLNTQFVLLESLRVQDERQRTRNAGTTPHPPPAVAVPTAPPTVPPTAPVAAPSTHPVARVQIRQDRYEIRGDGFEKTVPRIEATRPPPHSPELELATPPFAAPPTPSQSLTPPPMEETAFPPPAPEGSREARTPPILQALRSAGSVKRGSGAPPVLLVGFERGLSGPVVSALTGDGHLVLGHVPRRDVEAHCLGERRWPTSVLVAWRIHSDPESGAGPAEEQSRLMQRVLDRHPGWRAVAMPTTFGTEVAARLYGSGAHAVMPAVRGLAGGGDGALDALVAVMDRLSRDCVRMDQVQMAELRAWLQAKHLTTEMHRELERAHVALELMRVAARSLERAVLLFLRQGLLVGLGGFGTTRAGRPLAEEVRNLQLPLAAGSLAARSVSDRQSAQGSLAELGLSTLGDALGGPAVDRAVVVPLAASDGVLGLVYGDSGALNVPPKVAPELELAATQAGVAFANLNARDLQDRRRN